MIKGNKRLFNNTVTIDKYGENKFITGGNL